MGLSEKYDDFYASKLERELFSDIIVNNWPKNRVEAIIYVSGGGETVLDIGCGNGYLIYQFRHRYKNLIGLEFSAHRIDQARINLDKVNFTAIYGSAENMTGIPDNSVDRISNYPPAKPGAFGIAAPSKGAYRNPKSKALPNNRLCISELLQTAKSNTPANVKLVLPPRQSRGNSQPISADTIEHIPDVYAASGEMFRVLKPGGQLVINTPNIAFIKKRALLLFGRFPSTSQPNEGLGSDVLFDGGHLHYFTFRSLIKLLERAGFKVVRQIGYGKLGWIHNIIPSLLSGGVQIVAVKE